MDITSKDGTNTVVPIDKNWGETVHSTTDIDIVHSVSAAVDTEKTDGATWACAT